MRFAIGGRPASPGPRTRRARQIPVALPQHPRRQSSGEFRQANFRSERGTNENTNGLTSEYLQKGTEVSGDIDYLWAVADSRIQETKRSAHEADACAAGIQVVAG
jgi:hypothetical protein